MHIWDERNRPCVVDHVQDILVQTNHYRYRAISSIPWESGVDPERSEVDGDQKIGHCIPKRTVEHDHFNVDRIHIVHSNVVGWTLEVSDRAECVDGDYTNSDRMSCSTGSQRHTVVLVPRSAGVVPQSADLYRVLKFRRVSKRIISSKLPNGKLLPS